MTAEYLDVTVPVREAAGEGGDLRERVRNLVLEAIMKRKADPAAVRDVMKSAVTGLGEGYRTHADNVGESLRTAFSGLDEAVGKSLYAMRVAMQESWDQGRRFADSDLREAYDVVRNLEGDLYATLKDTSEKSQGVLKEEFTRMYEHLTRSGTDTGSQVKDIMALFSRDLGQVAGAAARDVKTDASEASGRLAAVTSGILHGLADALDKKKTS
jgi:hypothetical protein